MARRRIAVKIDTARVLQHAAHLQQPHGHHGEIRLHALAVSQAGCSSAISPIQAASRSDRLQVSLKAAPAALLPTGSGVVLIAVEGRVEVDKVDAVRVHASEDVEVASGPERLVDEVRSCHRWLLSIR